MPGILIQNLSERPIHIARNPQVKFARSATAKINQGVTSFRVNADLTGLQPGRYEMDVRRVPFEWQYYPVVVR